MQGFRKIDTDKWEFANEGFIRGQRHLLRNIQRRRSPHSQQIGSSSASSDEAGKAALEGEIEHLRKERNSMMQEVVELQRQQRGTGQHMELVNEKLQRAEKRQKQMVAFLGKIFQNPAFLARLQETRMQKSITSPRTTRKFVKHQAHEPGTSGSSPNGQIVKFRHELRPYVMDIDPVPDKKLPSYPLQDTGDNLVFGPEIVPFHVEDIAEDELAMMHEFLAAPEQAEAGPSIRTIDPRLKGKGAADPQPQLTPDYFVSFPEDLAKEKSVQEFPLPGTESIPTEEAIWSMGFETGAGMSSSNTELWSNVSNYDMPELGGLSDVWDIGLGGSSGIEKWSDEDSSFSELEKQEKSA
ncbi:hypothetical protein CDL12_17458 [Handroanthus impetiginosus]|uniref:HSF-type DNA-binding domain-containing protein n=1 Tax=Handroanthus impetiginosus TaxID=429701 RepID=A0A2G9GXH3_9LAMI|nr:hypothetical protein CDL12_17458 [Handroanthus impetiginosus]